MDLWRVARRTCADLDGRGGALAGGRWHSRGRPVVTCATSASLALLEVCVLLDLPREFWPDDYVLIRVALPDGLPARTVRPGELPDGWQGRDGERLCRPLGDAWLRARAGALLFVPSVLLPLERNALLNPRHPAARRAVVADTMPLGQDVRPR